MELENVPAGTGQGSQPQGRNGDAQLSPSRDAQQIAALLGGNGAPAEGRGETSQPPGEEGPPIFQGTQRVSLDGGKRLVDLTAERAAELVLEHEQREQLAVARQALADERRANTLYETLGQRVAGWSPERQRAFFEVALRTPEVLDRLGQVAQPAGPMSEVDEILRGAPAQPAGRPDHEYQQLKDVVQVLMDREVQRENATRQKSLGDAVDEQMAQHSVFKKNPKGTKADATIAPYARDFIMSELRQSQDPSRELPIIVARHAARTDEMFQARDRAALAQYEPVPTSQPGSLDLRPTRALSGRDMPNGGVKREALAALDRFARARSPNGR